jgi:biopolymer transport protein ExbB/TolQ
MNFLPTTIAGLIAAVVTTTGIFIINRYANKARSEYCQELEKWSSGQ